MKNSTTILAILLTLFFSATLNSCKDDDNNNTQTTQQLSNAVVQGNWRVTNYNEDGTDKTNQFSGYTFTFNANLSVVASGSSTINGTWATGTDDSKAKLVLLFAVASGPFEEISEDWEIINVTSTTIQLKHISGGNSTTDYLTFTKN